DIFSGLCDDILFSFQSCLQLAEHMKLSGTQEIVDYKIFQRTIKLCRFFANSLMHYIKEFTSFLVDSCCQLHQTYLQIYSKFPPSLHALVISEAHQDEIARGFLMSLDSLLLPLLAFRPFVEVVLSKTLALSPELHFPQCQLLLSLMALLPSQPQDVQTLWNSGSQLPEEIPRLPLFAALLLSLQQCPSELSLPVFLQRATETGQAEGPLTFYHYVCIHLCTFITSLSVSHFHLLVRNIVKACPAECYQVSFLGVLLRRLLFLMAPDHQLKFTQKFPPKDSENLVLWQHLSFQALLPLHRQKVAHELFVAGLVQCQEWLNSEKSLNELPQVVRKSIIQCNLFSILSLQTSLLQLNSPDHVVIAVLDFLSSVGKPIIPPDFQVQFLSSLSCLFGSLLGNNSWLIQQHAIESFTQFAEGTSHEQILQKCLNSVEIKSKVVDFLSKPSPKRICCSPTEVQYKSAVDTAERALETMKQLLQKSPSPTWLAKKLEALHTTLHSLKNSIH
uniref:Uncharacterized protein n=1 Tax=Laticauda laticaudata TaxID=8630 RepID=A0A8C5RLJ6_LATLA